MKYAYNNSILDSIVCKIKIEDKEKRYEHGSGVILQIDSEEYVYILTAKHCILGKDFNYKREEINITVYIKLDDIYKEIKISEQDLIIYDDNTLNDRAIIILKKEKDKILETIKSIEFFDLDSIPVECCFRGYPAPYNLGEATVGVTVGMCQFIENNVIGTKTKLETTVYDEALYNISGCSGGGVFVFYNNKLYLVSIVYAFEELFQRVKVNNISGYNELLNEHNCTLIKFNEYSAEKDIPLSRLKCEYQKAKAGWLADRYIPDLHVVGKIQYRTEFVVQSDRVVFNTISSLVTYKKIISEVLDTINYNLQDDRLQEIAENLKETIQYWNSLVKYIEKLIVHIRNSDVINYKMITNSRIDLDKLIYKVTAIKDKNYQFRNVRILKEEFEKIRSFQIEEKVSRIIHGFKTNYLIFLGDPGTGKTHALANIVDEQINDNLPAIIIQAKQYASATSWKEILADVLELSSSFSDDDIWNALEDTASRCEIGKKNAIDLEGKEIKFHAIVIICIDGIDEAVSTTNWINRIREIDVICSKYKKLRFIISSRPYKFKNVDIKNKVRIPADGDVYVHNIFDKYVEKYDVKFESENIRKRVKWSLRTPFALKLFCEKYFCKKLRENEKISTTIGNLLSEKIDRIDNEINIKLNNLWTDSEYIIKKILIGTVTYFINNDEYKISHDELINLLLKNDRLSEISKLNLSKILKYLDEYGLLYVTKEEISEDPLEDPITLYEIQIQPLIDYLIAVKLRNIDVAENKDFPNVLEERVEAQCIYSVILLEEKNILVGTEGIWHDYCDNEELIKIQSFALSNVSNDLARNYKDIVENIMRSSTKNFRMIVNNLISEVARIPDHPLGAEFLHNILMSYKTPIDRDIIWSGPEKMKCNNNEVWEGKSECICSVKGLELTSDDTFEGLPLIYAWHLTNLDNKIRVKIKNELTKWAIDNPKEYCKLLDKTFVTNDPQMKEDLILCLLGVVSSMVVSDEDLKEFAEWTIHNIFSENKIQNYRNVVIRFVGRILIEKAIKCNLIESKNGLLARPPYKFDSFIDIELSKKVVDRKDDYYSPIHGDLAWYVIKEAYNDFFRIDRELSEEQKKLNFELMKFMEEIYNENPPINTELDLIYNNSNAEDLDDFMEKRIPELEGKEKEQKELSMPEYSAKAIEFLELHAETVGEKFIMPHMFALAAAINYIEKMGWNDELERYEKNSNKEVYGYNIAISRQYEQATHGSMSKVMNLGEKYTWCAVHEIQGYLADRLPYYGYTDDGEEKYILDDYSVLIDINNTFISMQEIDENEIRNTNYPYIPNNLAPEIKDLKDDCRENIINWINRAEYPEFKQWLVSGDKAMKMVSDELEESWTCIYNYTVLTEKHTHTDSILWINSYIIKENDYNILKKQLEINKEEMIPYFVKTNEKAYSSPNVGTYIDPVTVNLIDWVKDLYAKHTIEYKINEVIKEYDVFKTISNVTYKTNNGEEFGSVMPSKIIRNLLGISITDGFNYKDNTNERVIFNSITGKRYNNEQNLLYVKTNKLNKVLSENGYKMFWVVKVLREPSLEVRDKYKDFFHDRYCVWIITDNTFESYKLCDEPKTW